MGSEATAVFSACFGAPFLPLHPGRYAGVLGERLGHGTQVWLVNLDRRSARRGHHVACGTRSLLSAVLNGSVDGVQYTRCDRFGWDVP